MTAHRVSVYTGPTLVKAMADRLRALGFAEVTEGTERVYCLAEGTTGPAAAWDAQVEYERAHGRAGGFHFRA